MILGINYSQYHDSSIALINKKNQVVFAASEERYSRVKKDGRFPIIALKNIDLKKVKYLAIPYLPKKENLNKNKFLFKNILFKGKSKVGSFDKIWVKNIEKLKKKTFFFEHNKSHAAAGLYLSSFDNATIVVSDFGSDNTKIHTAIYNYDKNKSNDIELVSAATFNDYLPICSIYTFTTALLGFKPNHHEGKITGLSANSKSNTRLQKKLINLFLNDNKSSQLFQWLNRWDNESPPSIYVNQHFKKILRNKIKNHSDTEIARAAQDIIEKMTIDLIKKYFKIFKPNSKNLVLSGGLFANVKLNYELSKFVKGKIFVCPPMSDEGNALGSAILLNNQKFGVPISSQKKINNIYWGNKIVIKKNQFEKHNVKIRKIKTSLSTFVSKALSEKKIFGIVNGRMEFGPRALGNRSIICECKNKNINNTLNNKLNRSEFMPFAPIMRIENAEKYFHIKDISKFEHTSKFMTICLKARDSLIKKCPAIVHVDNTARPQFISKKCNPLIYEVLLKYEKLSSAPALINTSFNVHEEPIVNDFSSSLFSAFYSNLDYLIINNKLVDINQNKVLLNLFKNFIKKNEFQNFNKNRFIKILETYEKNFYNLKINSEKVVREYKNLFSKYYGRKFR